MSHQGSLSRPIVRTYTCKTMFVQMTHVSQYAKSTRNQKRTIATRGFPFLPIHSILLFSFPLLCRLLWIFVRFLFLVGKGPPHFPQFFTHLSKGDIGIVLFDFFTILLTKQHESFQWFFSTTRLFLGSLKVIQREREKERGCEIRYGCQSMVRSFVRSCVCVWCRLDTGNTVTPHAITQVETYLGLEFTVFLGHDEGCCY